MAAACGPGPERRQTGIGRDPAQPGAHRRLLQFSNWPVASPGPQVVSCTRSRRRATTRSFDQRCVIIPPIRVGLNQEVVVTLVKDFARARSPNRAYARAPTTGRRDRPGSRFRDQPQRWWRSRRGSSSRAALSITRDPTAGFTPHARRASPRYAAWMVTPPSGPSTGSRRSGSSTTSGHLDTEPRRGGALARIRASTPAATTTSPTASGQAGLVTLCARTTAVTTGRVLAANASGSGRSTRYRDFDTLRSRRRHRSSPAHLAPCWGTAWAAASFSATWILDRPGEYELMVLSGPAVSRPSGCRAKRLLSRDRGLAADLPVEHRRQRGLHDPRWSDRLQRQTRWSTPRRGARRWSSARPLISPNPGETMPKRARAPGTATVGRARCRDQPDPGLRKRGPRRLRPAAATPSTLRCHPEGCTPQRGFSASRNATASLDDVTRMDRRPDCRDCAGASPGGDRMMLLARLSRVHLGPAPTWQVGDDGDVRRRQVDPARHLPVTGGVPPARRHC